MLVIAGLAPPIYAGTAAWKAGCLPSVLLAWFLLVVVPLGAMMIALPLTKSQPKRETIIAVQGALAIIGYLLSIPLSMIIIGLSSLRLR
jgi:hypothetical protein